MAAVDATAALLDAFAAPLEERRPALLPAARTGLEALRQTLRATRTGDTWPAPATVDRVALRRIQAALGGVLETLAAVPGLLEVAGS